ncbi:MAG: helix-turn-helix transcriptional regulator [Chitinophagaceae bacterium]
MHSINIDALSKMIKSKRSDRGLREVAKEIGISLSTLSRVENGNLPDIDSYMKLCKWLEVSVDFFTLPAQKADSMRQIVVANLRADKTLPKKVSESLVEMINLAYKSVK